MRNDNDRANATAFNAARLEMQIREAIAEANGNYTPGALEWARHNKPALSTEFNYQFGAVDLHFAAENTRGVLLALDKFKAAAGKLSAAFNQVVAAREFGRRAMPSAQGVLL